MNIVVSWILKFTRSTTEEINPDNNTYKLQYNESCAFYTFLHITSNLKYRNVYDVNMSKCI